MVETQKIRRIMNEIEHQGFKFYQKSDNDTPILVRTYTGEDEGMGLEVQLVVQIQPVIKL